VKRAGQQRGVFFYNSLTTTKNDIRARYDLKDIFLPHKCINYSHECLRRNWVGLEEPGVIYTTKEQGFQTWLYFVSELG